MFFFHSLLYSRNFKLKLYIYNTIRLTIHFLSVSPRSHYDVLLLLQRVKDPLLSTTRGPNSLKTYIIIFPTRRSYFNEESLISDRHDGRGEEKIFSFVVPERNSRLVCIYIYTENFLDIFNYILYVTNFQRRRVDNTNDIRSSQYLPTVLSLIKINCLPRRYYML